MVPDPLVTMIDLKTLSLLAVTATCHLLAPPAALEPQDDPPNGPPFPGILCGQCQATASFTSKDVIIECPGGGDPLILAVATIVYSTPCITWFTSRGIDCIGMSDCWQTLNVSIFWGDNPCTDTVWLWIQDLDLDGTPGLTVENGRAEITPDIPALEYDIFADCRSQSDDEGPPAPVGGITDSRMEVYLTSTATDHVAHHAPQLICNRCAPVD